MSTIFLWCVKKMWTDAGISIVRWPIAKASSRLIEKQLVTLSNLALLGKAYPVKVHRSSGTLCRNTFLEAMTPLVAQLSRMPRQTSFHGSIAVLASPEPRRCDTRDPVQAC